MTFNAREYFGPDAVLLASEHDLEIWDRALRYRNAGDLVAMFFNLAALDVPAPQTWRICRRRRPHSDRR